MGKIKRAKNIVELFLSGEKGQRFFNAAYSIGAAVVIWGALFKILHLQGGNTLLCIGMGTEVLMFLLTAFDKPEEAYKWERVFPALEGGEEDTDEAQTTVPAAQENNAGGVSGTVIISGGEPVEGGVINISGPTMPAGSDPDLAEQVQDATQNYLTQMQAIAEQMEMLRATTESLNAVSSTLLNSYRAITDNSENISSSSTGYVDQMESLNRNISGLNTIYEIQLKSISSQLDSIDRVNRGLKDIRDMYEKSAAESARYCDETEKMSRYMKQLNSVYEKMVKAMTEQMYRPQNPID